MTDRPLTKHEQAIDLDRLRHDYPEAAEELERLRQALRPFAAAHRTARSFLIRLGENRSVMETRDLYMWYAPRHLNMDNFARAVTALGDDDGG